jgi:hypothetical protein
MSTIPKPFPASQSAPSADFESENEDGHADSPPEGVIEVRLADPAEEVELAGLLKEGHYLGADRPVGDHLRQVVTRAGRRVAILAWGPACYALKDRDLWISWDATRRVERLSLLVQNRRFLLLVERGEAPNLASQVLAAAVRALPGHWQERFGYRPLLAETFTDPEAYQGTCYKASAWEPVGTSQGYERHRADFYREHGQPKRLWLRPLHPSAKALLRAPDTGVPVALAIVDQKENTPRSEQARAAEVLAATPLDERIVTGDALHATRAQARTIMEKGGDYLLQIKANQPQLAALAERARSVPPPFLN